MKARQIPKWGQVFSHLKSGVVEMKYQDRDKTLIDAQVTLVTGFIPENHQKEQSPNNPLNQEQMTAFDLKKRQWIQFELQSIKEYTGLVSYVKPRTDNDRPRTDTSRETSGNQRTQEEGNARKFRSRYDPEADKAKT